MGWIRRASREWLVVAGSIITALFGVNDALDIVSWKALDRWAFLLAFAIFFALVMARLVRLQERLDNRDRFANGIAAIAPHLGTGNRLLEECGRPDEQYTGASPMHLLQYCLPKINKWWQDVAITIANSLPEYQAKMLNLGNVTYNTQTKKASIQALEKALETLGKIDDELRSRLHGA